MRLEEGECFWPKKILRFSKANDTPCGKPETPLYSRGWEKTSQNINRAGFSVRGINNFSFYFSAFSTFLFPFTWGKDSINPFLKWLSNQPAEGCQGDSRGPFLPVRGWGQVKAAARQGWTQPVLGGRRTGWESQLCQVFAGPPVEVTPLRISFSSSVNGDWFIISFVTRSLIEHMLFMCLALGRAWAYHKEQDRHTLKAHILRQQRPTELARILEMFYILAIQ